MKDVMIVSLIIIVLSLLVFMYFEKRREVKNLMEQKTIRIKKDSEESRTMQEPFIEKPVKDIAAQDMAAIWDIYTTREK